MLASHQPGQPRATPADLDCPLPAAGQVPSNRLPRWFFPVSLGLGVLGLATPNPDLTAAGLLLAPLLIGLLWRPGEPPILVSC